MTTVGDVEFIEPVQSAVSRLIDIGEEGVATAVILAAVQSNGVPMLENDLIAIGSEFSDLIPELKILAAVLSGAIIPHVENGEVLYRTKNDE